MDLFNAGGPKKGLTRRKTFCLARPKTRLNYSKHVTDEAETRREPKTRTPISIFEYFWVLRVIDMCYVYAGRLAAFATSAFGTLRETLS